VYGYSAIPLQDQVHAAKYAGSLFRCADLIAGKFFGYFRMLTGRIGMEEKNRLLADTLALCGERLLILKTSKGVPKNVAEFFIEHCAWWDHPSVGWTRAPKYSQRIEWGNYGWEVRFGGNIFLVGLAIERCVEMVQNLLDLAGRGKRYYSYLELEKAA
jgi:hypothetical protein